LAITGAGVGELALPDEISQGDAGDESAARDAWGQAMSARRGGCYGLEKFAFLSPAMPRSGVRGAAGIEPAAHRSSQRRGRIGAWNIFCSSSSTA
jgi:hypothetical protein